MTKKAVTGIVVAGIFIIAAILGWRAQQSTPSAFSPSPQQLPLPQARKVDKATEALHNRNWVLVESMLQESTTREQTVSQILKYAETKESASDHAEIYKITLAQLKNKTLPPKERVLLFRTLSFMNLNLKQQQEVKSLFKVQKFQKESLPQVFISSLPFPKDQTQFLASQVRSQTPGHATDALYLAGQIKDNEARLHLTQQLLNEFNSVKPVLKPYVAKFVIVQSDAKIREEKSYLNLITYVRQQKGDLWAEVARVIE